MLIKQDFYIKNMETVTLSKQEYEHLKEQAEIDIELLHQLTSSLRDIKEGKVRRVK